MTEYEMVIDPELKRQSDEIAEMFNNTLKAYGMDHPEMEFVDSQGMTIEQVGKVRLIMSNQWAEGYTKGEETIDLDESEYEIID